MTGHRAVSAVEVRLSRVEPTVVVVGRGSLVVVEGSCYSTERIVRIDVLLGSVSAATATVRLERWFQAILAVPESVPRGATDLLVRVFLWTGEVRTAHLGAIEVTDRGSLPLASPSAVAAEEPLIAVCLAAREPPPQLFARQIASIRAQSHERFVCIISDDQSSPESWALIERVVAEDERFSCSRTPRRLGFYRNFERCLELVPLAAEYVAFADQDDAWYPDKLATLLDRLHVSGALLAYSDMNIVAADGQHIASTHWTERSNNSTELGSLVIVNTVTGAASLFRRELLDDALPFPPDVGHPYHDHWIACVALASGELAYVDRPLYDYVQHEANVAGHAAEDFRSGLLTMLLRFAVSPGLRLRNTIGFARTLYLTEVVRLELIARTLELRLSGRMAPDRAAEVRRLARLSSSLQSVGWLLGRSVRDVRGHGETMGFENQLLKGILWRHGQAVRARLQRVRG